MRDEERPVVDAAVAIAREHGVVCLAPRVVRGAASILVHLAPAPILVRASLLDLGVPPAIQLALAAHAFARGAAVVPPADELPPGPHIAGGRTLTFWRYVEHDPTQPPDAVGAGRALRTLHDALADFDGPLPPYHRLDHARTFLVRLEPDELVDEEDVAALRESAALVGASLPQGGTHRPLHGDAHLGNVLRTPAGPLWTDLENACRGPVEYDLACLRWRERVHGWPQSAAAAAYGPHDRRLVEALFPALGLFLATVTIPIVRRLPTDAGRAILRERLDYVRSLRTGEAL